MLDVEKFRQGIVMDLYSISSSLFLFPSSSSSLSVSAYKNTWNNLVIIVGSTRSKTVKEEGAEEGVKPHIVTN